MTAGQPRPLADTDPRQLGRFTVLGLLGEGGMGRVFLGSSPGGWTVAIKVIHAGLAADPAFRARFAHEVATARAVGGFYTAPVVDADTEGEQPWLAVAYVAGPSLAEAVTQGGPMPPHAVRRLGLGLAEALQAIHAAGVIHRDLKPSNVLLAADGPRVIDFGIARAAEHSSLTRTGTILGSAGFMAPEQITGAQTGPAIDVFALGAVLTFAATGQGPFGEGRTEALAYRVVYGEPNLDGLPAAVREIVARCLAKDPQHRPGPGEVIAAFTAIPATGPATGEGWLPQPVERLVGLHQAVEHRAAETAAMTASPAPQPPPAGAAPTITTRGSSLPRTTPPMPPPAAFPPLTPGPQVPGAAPQPSSPVPQPSAYMQQPPPQWAQPPMRRDAARRPRRRLLWAVALGIVLAAGGAIIATSLSKSSGPPRSARLAASSPAVRPATSAATGAQSPQATASASATGSASSGPVAGSSPAAVVQAYFTAINNHDCATAWHLGGDNISAARGQSYQQFCQGFSTTSHDAVTVDSAAGNTVTVTVVAQQTDGSSRTFHGTYVVANGAINSATVQASS